MKILIKIKNDRLQFINKKKLNTEYKNMLNTNVISNNELVFSDEYILLNQKIVITFLNELINNYSINTLSFQNIEIFSLIYKLIPKIKKINSIYMESDEIMTYKLCEKICKLNNIKYISFAYIPVYMFELIDKNGIIPESRNEILFTSNFMETNDLKTYSGIFYKNSILLEFPLSNEDIEDFDTFCNINRHLKIIHVNKINKYFLELVVNILINNKQKNIKIVLHGDEHDPAVIEYLKKNNKIIKKKYKISFKLKYSKKYIEENFANETNNTILRTCGLIIFAIVIFSFIYVFYDNYKSMMKVSKIQNEVVKYINATDTKDIETNNNSNSLPIKNNYIYSLKEINSDVVAWLKVNNTNIDYPIVQTFDNEYYLKYNLYREKDSNGWLFMDYDNNTTKIDDNIIIYGHNRYLNGVMFGTLNKTLYKNWYTNKENQIIKFDTLYGSYQYKVFSIYIIPTTSDYLETNFDNSKDKINFLNMLKDRSIYDFNITLNENSKIITLSTCQSDTTRLVLHAVLI